VVQDNDMGKNNKSMVTFVSSDHHWYIPMAQIKSANYQLMVPTMINVTNDILL
jgi:hypothetical protein